ENSPLRMLLRASSLPPLDPDHVPERVEDLADPPALGRRDRPAIQLATVRHEVLDRCIKVLDFPVGHLSTRAERRLRIRSVKPQAYLADLEQGEALHLFGGRIPE